MTTEFAREIAAQAWCTPETEHLEMVPELAEAFAKILDGILEAIGSAKDSVLGE